MIQGAQRVARGFSSGRGVGHLVRSALLVATLLVSSVALAGCLYVGERSSGGWQRAPRDIADDWRDLDMQDLMAFSDTWFVADAHQRGTVRGFPSGGVSLSSTGGYFELSVLFRQYDVPVEQTVRVYFDQVTPVYSGGSAAGTVLDGLTRKGGLDVTQAGRIVEVPFFINGGRLFAERVNLLEERSPLAP